MLSIPRDMAVRDPMTGETVKVNTIYGLGEIRGYPGGGAEYMRQTLSEVTGYPIDYQVTVNFDGFRQIIDLVNGIDIDVPKDIIDNEYPTEDYGTEKLFIPKGLQHMDGDLALKYARTRHGDSDYVRAARQAAGDLGDQGQDHATGPDGCPAAANSGPHHGDGQLRPDEHAR